MDLSALVKKWREYADLTPTQLAASCGVSDVAVYYWEHGRTQPTHANVAKIAAACGAKMPGFWSGPPRRSKRRRAA
jgi:transcriptional regulator with XRE-family HTH domain